jgi:arylsulfatase A
MKIPITIAALAVAFLIAGFPTDSSARSGPPNIVFVLIDDLGWMDLACQGNRLVETPHLDRLAAQGMRFTDAYAAAPVCSPTRAAILTGKSPARLRITNHIPDRPQFTPPAAKLWPAAMLDHLPLQEVTLAERLKAAVCYGVLRQVASGGARRPVPVSGPSRV